MGSPDHSSCCIGKNLPHIGILKIVGIFFGDEREPDTIYYAFPHIRMQYIEYNIDVFIT